MLKSEKYPHPLSQANTAQLNDVDEGGLNLGQVGSALRRRALLVAAVTGLVATGAVLKAEHDPPVYQGEFEVLTKSLSAENKAISDVPQTLSSQKLAASEPTQEVQTMIAVLQSRKVLNPIVEQLQDKYPKLTYEELLENLTIESKKQSILEVQYIDADEKLVVEVSKLLADAYLDYSRAERQAEVNQAIEFVNKQIQPIEERVQLWQNKLRNLRLENKLIDPEQKAQEVSTHIATLTQQRLENRVQLEQMRAKYQDLQTELAQQPGASASNSLLSDNPRYQKLLDQIQEVNAQIAKRSSVFTDEEEGIKRLNEQKETNLSLLQQERERVNRDFQSRIRELEARDRGLDAKIISLNNYVKELATTSREYDNIQRELKVATEGLTQFTTKQQALQIEKAQKQQSWQLLDPKLTKVTEPDAVSDSAKKNLALGAMLGLLLGVGAALIVDKLSNVFYTSKDLKEATRLPLLGVVPLRKELGSLLPQVGEQAGRISFFEVFRSLYTNILLLGSDTPIRSLVVSSAGQGDGKSTVAVQLAQAAAAMGQRVLLVDANLRCPTLHNRVGLMNIQGLTDVISQDLEWSNVVERSPLEENLFVMSAGPIPPDSVRLLASQKMQDLMDDLQASYDLVIYDTPPLLGFADAYLLAANTNGMVLVAGLGKLKRTVLQQALEEIQVSGTPILGLIANKSKDSIPSSYSHYQQYYRQNMSGERFSDDGDHESVNSASMTKIKRR
ncbi:MAG: polysaccharide biosynthesis tyrosine autokinase [Hassallia sp. WJT32-NPBG1]|jgi:capsular exopolysaccharide synthesis family protein|nr:polysaccharide biosynthesis tyrosine autokinase [Hassallia sp. WJT32-NPBG1]